MIDVHDLPVVNAVLNGIATCFLVMGWIAIKRFNAQIWHRNMMIGALVTSALFLSCYLYYHYNAGAMTPFEKEGFIRIVYFTILITHIPLATLMVPFIFAALWYAWRKQYATHVRIVRYVWPVWMYVSVTGVLIYLMLYQM